VALPRGALCSSYPAPPPILTPAIFYCYHHRSRRWGRDADPQPTPSNAAPPSPPFHTVFLLRTQRVAGLCGQTARHSTASPSSFLGVYLFPCVRWPHLLSGRPRPLRGRPLLPSWSCAPSPLHLSPAMLFVTAGHRRVHRSLSCPPPPIHTTVRCTHTDAPSALTHQQCNRTTTKSGCVTAPAAVRHALCHRCVQHCRTTGILLAKTHLSPRRK